MHQSPWKLSITLGRGFDEGGRFNNDAIFFVRLADSDDKPIARQPISVAAILESRANYQEYECKRVLLESIEDPVSRAIEERQFKEEVISNLYHPDLTLYSAAAHLMASAFGTTDAITAYAGASALGQFVLQCPRMLLSQFVVQEKVFRSIADADAIQRVQESVRRGHIESLFCYIAMTNDWRGVSAFDFPQLVENLSRRYFNCDGMAYRESARAEYDLLVHPYAASKYPHASAFASAIAVNSALLLNQTHSRIDFTNHHLPRCYLGDGTVPAPFLTQVHDSPVADIDPEHLFFALDDHATWIRTFSEA